MKKATFVNIFFSEVIKFYWLMLLLYPGELYRLLGASSSFGHYVVFTDSGIFTLFLQYWIKSHKLKHLSQTNGIIPLYNIYSTYIEIRLVVTIPRDIYKNIVFPSQQHHISLSTISCFPYSKFARFNALGHITVFHVSKDNSRDVPK